MKELFARRNILELGLGSAVVAACSRTAANSATSAEIKKQEGDSMPTLKEFNSFGEELVRHYLFRYV